MASAGWYVVPGSSEVRWRDDRNWTAYRIRNGKPGGDWFAMEPPWLGYALSAVFLSLAATQAVLAGIGGSPITAVFFLLAGILWLTAAASGSVIRGKPDPQTPRIAPACVQPVPGQVEGPGAGWYPVSSRIRRWFSGVRWASYVHDSIRVRPTFGGPAMYRGFRVAALVLLGTGVLALLLGIAVRILPGDAGDWAAWPLWLCGVALVIVGAIVFPIMGMRRAELLLPDSAPPGAR